MRRGRTYGRRDVQTRLLRSETTIGRENKNQKIIMRGFSGKFALLCMDVHTELNTKVHRLRRETKKNFLIIVSMTGAINMVRRNNCGDFNRMHAWDMCMGCVYLIYQSNIRNTKKCINSLSTFITHEL